MTTFLWIAGWYCAGLLGCWLVRKAVNFDFGVHPAATHGTAVLFLVFALGGPFTVFVGIVVWVIVFAENVDEYEDHPLVRWWRKPLRWKASDAKASDR